jgi:glycerophosphoryl diester phosphodiesterase
MEDFRIFAHRGASGTEPENTLLSFRRALELGAEWVE